MGYIYAALAHTQGPCPNGETLKFYFYLRLLHPKAVADKAAEYFFLLASSLIFEMPIPGGSTKRPWYLFLGACYVVLVLVFYSQNKCFSTGDFGVR
jgi:hypothetical protein